MLSKKLSRSPAAMAVALLALVPATASATKRHGRVSARHQAKALGGCRLDVNAAPRFIERAKAR
jgi:hypothetical protein